ncbi:hypothetical protein [Mucilaginibacter sp. L3T2-6]|uniref:hypothetical protein n=1 Tax=Mucilaginibacter sp. L3T2-6 TaxID=3062491 RepID=UPI0026752EB4|nr:hypothetical protein [Mucilaginibacter sp. L3T2-6]MDO3644869.1 hypothetical protein [Mucilaginibacter sp. L3T2-6]MDV6217321.1 hypothetical protein [Mucilaginibacter sp. L3T2-6]
MKTILPILLISIMLWSCSKKADVKPTSADTTKTGNGNLSATPGSASKLSHDDSIHMAAFIIYPQNVKTSVNGKVLKLVFDEKVNIFLMADAYNQTYAVHLKEDFKKSVLAAFDFTTEGENGQTAFNYVDDNLNNIRFKTLSDTLIQGVKVKKIAVHRQLTFSRTYDSPQLAADQQNLILARYDDFITFSSYTYYNQKNYPTTSAKAYIKYGK